MEHLGTILVGLIIAGMIVLAVRSLLKTRNAGGCPGCAGGSSGSTPKKNKLEKPVDLTDYPYEMNVRIDGMTCEHCVHHVKEALESLDGVYAEVSLAAGQAHLHLKTVPDQAEIQKAVKDAGYTAVI